MDYIEVRTHYPKMTADGGKSKITNEKYVVQASSRYDAEAMTLNEIRPHIENNGIAEMASKIIPNMQGVLFSNDGGLYYYAKVRSFSVATSKRVLPDAVYLIQAANFALAYDTLKAFLAKCNQFWEIEKIIETRIEGVLISEYE